jgi:hypothetical protein
MFNRTPFEPELGELPIPIHNNNAHSNIVQAIDLYNALIVDHDMNLDQSKITVAELKIKVANAQNLSSIAQSLRDIHVCLSR